MQLLSVTSIGKLLDSPWPSSDAQGSHLNVHCAHIARMHCVDPTVSNAVQVAVQADNTAAAPRPISDTYRQAHPALTVWVTTLRTRACHADGAAIPRYAMGHRCGLALRVATGTNARQPFSLNGPAALHARLFVYRPPLTSTSAPFV
jgi:hypothetical protein